MSTVGESGELLQQSLRTFQSLLRIGTEMQEQSAQCFADRLLGMASQEQWPRPQIIAVQELIHSNRQKTEETIHLINENARESLDLIRRAMCGQPLRTCGDHASGMTENWELDLKAICHLESDRPTTREADAPGV